MSLLSKILSPFTKPGEPAEPKPAEPAKPSVKAGEMAALLGMSSDAERDWLEDYGARVYSGAGTLVDLGSWLGSLTIPLLVGLDRNPATGNGSTDLHAYDLFQWADWMKPWQLHNADGPLKPGDTFLPEFVRRVGPYDRHQRLLIHAGDLVRLGWCGRPIELLVVDVMKNWDLANCVVRDFFPYLLPGQSYVFHQDFCHFYTSWIHLIHYRLRDHFEKVASLPNSGTVVFKYTKAFPPESLRKTYSFADFSDAEVEAAFEFSLRQVDADQMARRQAVMAAKVMVFVHKNDPERARRELDSLAAQGWVIGGELKSVQDDVNQRLNKVS
jgi:hypothetical protein